MNEDENIDNIAQTFFLLMILCSVISDSHFVIHERSPRIQYLFDSLQALFIFGFTQKQQERIIWEKPAEMSSEGDLPRVFDSCKEIYPEVAPDKPPSKVSFQEPIQTILQPSWSKDQRSLPQKVAGSRQSELPPKKKKLLEDRNKEKSISKRSKRLATRMAPQRGDDDLLPSAPLRGAKKVESSSESASTIIEKHNGEVLKENLHGSSERSIRISDRAKKVKLKGI